jgi:hypothetical protein
MSPMFVVWYTVSIYKRIYAYGSAEAYGLQINEISETYSNNTWDSHIFKSFKSRNKKTNPDPDLVSNKCLAKPGSAQQPEAPGGSQAGSSPARVRFRWPTAASVSGPGEVREI